MTRGSQRLITHRALGRLTLPLVAALIGASGLMVAAPAGARAGDGNTYRNPLDITAPDLATPVENCADPTVTKQRRANGAYYWWMYCTKDPRNDEDAPAGGAPTFQLIPIYRSSDLVNWTYKGNVFQDPAAPSSNYPTWVEPDSGLFAPEIKRMNGQWYLYYTVENTKPAISGEPEGCRGDFAIGVATAPSPDGPWTDSDDPVIDPRRGGDGCNFFWTIDPEVKTLAGQRYIFWGSYYGGIFVRRLTEMGFETDPATQDRITVANKFEGPEIIKRDGWYYLFVSATNCCNGDLTAYGVFVGRSTSLFGPYVDRSGVSLREDDDADTGVPDPTDAEVGGTPVLQINGNRWLGVGHNTVFRDFSGRFWTIYHAVDRKDPTFACCPAEAAHDDDPGFTKRPALLDPIAWIDGWPQVRGGRWASNVEMPAPAAQPGQPDRYRPSTDWRSNKGDLMPAYSDEFEGTSLDPRWSFTRPVDPATYEVSGGLFKWDTQGADLYKGSNNASVLVQDAPDGEYILEARIHMTVPSEGNGFNYRQGGLVIYDGDDQFLKLVEFANWETRQTEWAKEVPADDPGSRYGNGVVGPPGDWTTLRIVKADFSGGEFYQAWTKRDGGVWERGGTWRYDELGDDSKIGIVSMAGPDFETHVDWVRVYSLNVRGPIPIDES